MNTLFRISNSIMDAIDWEDIQKTVKDMIEMGLKLYPFDHFAIEVSPFALENFMKKIAKFHDEEFEPIQNKNLVRSYLVVYQDNKFKIIRNDNDGKQTNMLANAKNQFLDKKMDEKTYDELTLGMKHIASNLSGLLIVVLATKNIEKNDVVDKNLARGKFNKRKAYRKDYPITTTITIGKITETHTSGHGGGTVRPHLRRGHIRTQKYGPKYELSKKIFIEPVFVNADEGWISERRAYNVKAA